MFPRFVLLSLYPLYVEFFKSNHPCHYIKLDCSLQSTFTSASLDGESLFLSPTSSNGKTKAGCPTLGEGSSLPWAFLRLLGLFVSRMGSGNWFKAMICLGKTKGSSKKAKGSLSSGKPSAVESNGHRGKGFNGVENGAKSESRVLRGVSLESIAATRIQTAYRAYKARKSLRRMKGFAKLKIMTQRQSVKKQADTTLSYLHEWSKIQGEIRARRICMVTEDRVKRKKLLSQQKLEAKLHDLEVEWCGGPETMEEILTRIHYREEAAVKRERALAYAFSHQWRSNSSQKQGLGNYELNKGNWGWSWKDRWIAARPWESRNEAPPKKAQTKQASKVQKDKNSTTPKSSVLVEPTVVKPKARRLSYSDIEKTVTHEGKL